MSDIYERVNADQVNTCICRGVNASPMCPIHGVQIETEEDKEAIIKPGESTALTVKQEQHLNNIQIWLEHRLDLKYRRGALEHGGELEDMNKYDLLENAIDEAIDQVVYLLTLRTKL